MKKRAIGAAIALGVLGAAMSTAGAATAGEPVTKGCVGESISANARGGAYGPTYVLPYASGGIGFEVHLLQAGGIPDGIYPNTCNDL